MQDYQENFGVCDVPGRGQAVFLIWQLLGGMYRLLKLIVTKSSLSHEDDWDAIHFFCFGKTFSADSDFLRKRSIQTAASGVVKTSVDLEKERSQKSGTEQMHSN